MKRYRARPIEIEALLWQGDLEDLPQEWLDRELVISFEVDTNALFTKTLQGPGRAEVGRHYLIPNLDEGEVYPVRRDIFERRYEEIR
jgi:hypothetical protein